MVYVISARCAYPASVFGWGYSDPFSDNLILTDRTEEVTVIVPAAEARYTTYYKLPDYGTTWVAYDRPLVE